MGKRLMAALALAAMVCAGTARAEDAPPPTGRAALLEEEVVVSAPIIEGNEVTRYAGQYTEVTQEQISDLNAQDMSSALRRTPGVNISRYNPVGSFGGAEGGGVFIRGMGSSRPGSEIMTMYDGVPRYNPVFSHPLLDMLPMDPAQSIRVYKGVQPAEFGNAFSAIDVIPKRMTEDGYRTRLFTSYGSYNTFTQGVEHGGKQGGVDYYAGQSVRLSDGHREHSDGQIENYFGRLGYDLYENWNVSWFGNVTRNVARDPGSSLSTGNDGRFYTDDVLNVITLANDYGDADGHIKVYWNNGYANWAGQKGNADTTISDWDLYGLRAREAFRAWEGGEVTAGFDYDVMSGKALFENDNGTSSEFEREDFVLFSPYAAVSHEFGSRDGFYAIPSAGMRFYTHNEFGDQVAPHTGLVFGYRDTELHAGYARGVNYPGLNVAVFSENVIPPIMGGPFRDDWKNLDPELVDHFEAGVSQKLWGKVKADLTAFWDEGTDRYAVVQGTPKRFRNIESFTIQGLEGTLTYTPFADLSVYAGATWLDTFPSDLPYAPEWTFSAGLNWRFLQHFRLSLDAQYVTGEQVLSQGRTENAVNASEVDPYHVVNGRIAYVFDYAPWEIKEAEVYLALENITDSDYEYRPGYRMPGSSATVGLSVTF